MLLFILSNIKQCSDAKKLVALATLVVFFTACAPYQAKKRPAHFKDTGSASWYGPGFAGKRTASGERFNPNAMTAAHKTLPMGTEVEVTNVENGKSVVVRINDRGPFVGGRVIDLSKAAAKDLGMLGTGTAEVTIAAISKPAEETEDSAEEVAVKPKKSKKKDRSAPKNAESDDDNVSPDDKDGVSYLISKSPKIDEKEVPIERSQKNDEEF